MTTLAAAAAIMAAQIVTPANDPSRPSQPLESGSKSTPFSLKLPSGAACTHDSANAGYRVQSFMVPAGTDASSLTYDASGPAPNSTGRAFRQPLYSVTGTPFVDAQTAPSAKKDDPGFIVNLPAFNLNAFMPGDIPAGDYELGVACTKPAGSDPRIDGVWETTFRVDGDGHWTTSAVPASAAAAATPTTATADPAAAASRRDPEPATTQPEQPVERGAIPPGGDPSFTLPAIDGIALPNVHSKAAALLWFAVAGAIGRVLFLLSRRPRALPLMEDQ